MIVMERVSFAYPAAPGIFEDFSWQVERGQSWAVLGPSGCGKTTLLYLLSGLQFPSRGQIRIDDSPLLRPRPQTGLILQDYGLLPWSTVRQNVALGQQIRRFYGPDGLHAPTASRTGKNFTPQVTGASAENAEKAEFFKVKNASAEVDKWLERLGLAEHAAKYPAQLSGGQRQRGAIARTLVLQPDLLLMDEPFAALDAPTRLGLEDLTLQLWQEQHFSFVVVTHAIEEAAYLGQSILVLGHPPHRSGKFFNNPVFGQPQACDSAAYRDLCRRLRAELESAG